MTTIGFTVRFHGPFRVGAAYGRDGRHAAVDLDTPLPGDHLKGLMRACARDVLGLNDAQVAEVFGGFGPASGGGAGAWAWTAAEPDRAWRFGVRHRVAIDSVTHTAAKDHLVAAEYAFAEQARFQVRRIGAVPADRLGWHGLVLRAAGAGVHGLGAWRRRGLGWVGVQPDEPLTDEEITRLVAARPAADGAVR